METEKNQAQNQQILAVLDCLQEYIRTQSSLQSTMVDGFMELAKTRRFCSGFVCPELISSPDLETRTFFQPDCEIGENPIKPFIPGVATSYLDNIQNHFERSLQTVINLVNLLGKLNQQLANNE